MLFFELNLSDLTLIQTVLTFLLLFILSYQDFREKRISLIYIIALFLINICSWNLSMLCMVMYLLVPLYFLRKFIAIGDIVMILFMLPMLNYFFWPWFLVGSGLFGLILHVVLKDKEIPFVPALSCSYIICDLIQKFLLL